MDKYVELARQTVEKFVVKRHIIKVPPGLPAEMYERRAGVFVSIYNNGELRGCVGTYLPTKKNIAEEIISSAILASTRDNRFYPITEHELPVLTYEISILGEPESIKNVEGHDAHKKGIIVQCKDGRCGLLLPGLEGIDSAEQQIHIASKKGGIDPEKDEPELFSFTVEKHL